ncbi:hypothetical protein HMPREF1551_01264 [Capnocytophaga sp. oral taxon 863 str. F0517]|nr:hypothetical protein HMPREF1551_01264 [Capnocytophaga sp. oral taxon 863 str. F0517]
MPKVVKKNDIKTFTFYFLPVTFFFTFAQKISSFYIEEKNRKNII